MVGKYDEGTSDILVRFQPATKRKFPMGLQKRSVTGRSVLQAGAGVIASNPGNASWRGIREGVLSLE